MENLIKELSLKKVVDSSKIGSFSYQLREYYEDNDRHRYSEVSKVIFSLDDDKVDTLRFNLEAISLKTVDGSILKNIEKLIDHTDLAQQQKKFIEDQDKELEVLIRGMHKAITKAKTEMTDNKTEFDAAKDKLEERETKVKEEMDNILKEIDEHRTGIYTQFVTILGIFTAIIIGVFGGIEIIGNVMNNIETVKISKLLMFSSLVMGSIITILYLLLISLSNLTGNPIRSCGCNNGSECKHALIKKHPIYIISMILSLYLFIIGTIAQGFGTNDLKGLLLLDKFMNNGYSIVVVAIIILVIFLFTFIPLFRSSGNDK